MDTAKHLAISALGLAGPEAVNISHPISTSNAELITKLAVQIAIGLVTIGTLIIRSKKAK